MGSGTRCRRPFLRMVRNTVYGRAGRDAVKAAVAWIRPLRSLDAFENARLWSARSKAGAGRARSSAEEHCLHTAGVAGSNPAAPTSLRPLRGLRLGKPSATLVAKRAKAAAPKPWRRRAVSRLAATAFPHTDWPPPGASARDLAACGGKFFRVTTKTSSLNVFNERGCSYLVCGTVQIHLNGAWPAVAAERRREGGPFARAFAFSGRHHHVARRDRSRAIRPASASRG